MAVGASIRLEVQFAVVDGEVGRRGIAASGVDVGDQRRGGAVVDPEFQARGAVVSAEVQLPVEHGEIAGVRTVASRVDVGHLPRAGAVMHPDFPATGAVIGGEVQLVVVDRKLRRARTVAAGIDVRDQGGGGSVVLPQLHGVGRVLGGEVECVIKHGKPGRMPVAYRVYIGDQAHVARRTDFDGLRRGWIIVRRPVVRLHLHGRVEDHLHRVSAGSPTHAANGHRVRPRRRGGSRLQHGILTRGARRCRAERNHARVKHFDRRLKRGVGIHHHRDRLAGVHVDGEAVGVAGEPDRARNGRVVDQAAQRVLRFQRRGIGNRRVVEDETAGVRQHRVSVHVGHRAGQHVDCECLLGSDPLQRIVDEISETVPISEHVPLAQNQVIAAEGRRIERFVEVDPQGSERDRYHASVGRSRGGNLHGHRVVAEDRRPGLDRIAVA